MNRFLILHLEDDPSLKATMLELLTTVEPDSEVQQFTNSDDAVRFIETESPVDLFLLDVRVPGSMDGIGVAKHIRSLGIHAPIVFMSAYSRPGIDVLDDEIDFRWVHKPWPVEKLIELLEEVRQ